MQSFFSHFICSSWHNWGLKKLLLSNKWISQKVLAVWLTTIAISLFSKDVSSFMFIYLSISKIYILLMINIKFTKDLMLPWWLSDKESAANEGDTSSIPGSGRPSVEGNGNPLHMLIWKIPWTQEPSGLQSSGLKKSWKWHSN